MRHRQFLIFMLPTMLVMLLFIAVPLISVAVQSLFVEHEQVMKSVESCGPFGCRTQMQVDTEAMKTLRPHLPARQNRAVA